MQQHIPPIRYLGVPLYHGRCKISFFDDIIRKVQARVSGWHGLSFGGKRMIVKHVLASLPIYLLAAASPPRAVIRRLHSIFARFFWGSNEGNAKHHWLSWSSLCKPLNEGGVGFRDLNDIYKALKFKLCWTLLHSDGLWASFLKAKYCEGLSFDAAKPKTCMSRNWQELLHVRSEFHDKIQFMLGAGNSGFFITNWSGLGALRHFFQPADWRSFNFKRISIQEAFSWGSQLVDVISPLLPADVLSFLTNVALPCIPQSRDRFIWLPDNHGEFSTKSACVAIRGNPQSVTHLQI